jgi:hypothetical protein
MDAAAGDDQFHCQTNAASVTLKDNHTAKRAIAGTASLSAQQTRALQDARHRAEMAEAEARRSKAETITLATARLRAAPFFRIALRVAAAACKREKPVLMLLHFPETRPRAV